MFDTVLVRSTEVMVPATVVPLAVVVTPSAELEPAADVSAANTTVAASPTLTEPISDSDTLAGMMIFVMSDIVMNPLLVLTFELDVLEPDEPAEDADPLPVPAPVDEDPVDEELLDEDPVDEDPVEEEPVDDELDEATAAEPGAEPTVPFTVTTVAAAGEVSVQSASAAWAFVRFVRAVVTATACCVVLASACVSDVSALLTCC